MPRVLRVVIVDDERLARVGIRRMLERLTGNAAEVVAECATGEAAVRAIMELHPDLVFLDIQMPGLDGFEVVREVGLADMPALIFVTAYDRYAVDAFALHALDYLVKPVDPERFEEAFLHAKRRIEEGSLAELHDRLARVLAHVGNAGAPAGSLERIAVEEGARTFLLDLADVERLEAEGNYVRLHVEGGSHLVRRTLKSFERDLDTDHFLRVRRSIIVNLERLGWVERGDGEEYILHMRSGARVRSARRYFADINEFLRRHR